MFKNKDLQLSIFMYHNILFTIRFRNKIFNIFLYDVIQPIFTKLKEQWHVVFGETHELYSIFDQIGDLGNLL